MKKYPFCQCENPQRIYNKYTKELMVVGCGRCKICKSNRGFRLSRLCDLEAAVAVQVVFATLTYDPVSLPSFRVEFVGNGHYDCFLDDGELLGTVDYGSSSKFFKFLQKVNINGRVPMLSKTDLQKFFKRLRKSYGKKVRYFACGEYGPEHFRPHYHVLFFFDSSDCFSRDGNHVIGEFPRYTWSKQDEVTLREDTSITDFEYYLRSSWPFGRVDCSYITEGSCSQYVASYVNGFVDLPSFFTLPSTKCFCCHSRFLGRQVLREEFATYVLQKPESVAKRIQRYGDSFRESLLPREDIASIYPRCKGYSVKSRGSRKQSYLIYEFARDYYGKDLRCIDLASRITDSLVANDPYNDVTLYFFASTNYRKRVEDYRWLFYSTEDLHLRRIYFDDFSTKLLFSVYSELLVSKMFVDNALTLREIIPAFDYVGYEFRYYTDDQLYDFYLDRIDDMYSYIDLQHLSEMYEAQEEFIGHYGVDDIEFFYNNGKFDIGSFRQSIPHKVFTCNRLNYLKSKGKHKLQNDLNGMFL